MGVKIKQPWAVEAGNLSVSGDNDQATTIEIEVSEPGSGYGPSETQGTSATMKLSADEWREVVSAVERHLITRGDWQR